MAQGQARSNTAEYRPLVTVLVAVCLGIIADRYLALPLAFWWTAAVFALGMWLVAWLRGRSDRWTPRRELVTSLVLLVAVGASAGAWHHLCWRLYLENDLGRFACATSSPVCLRARVTRSPLSIPAPPPDPFRILPAKPTVHVELDVLEIRDGNKWQPVTGRTSLLVRGSSLDCKPGEMVTLFGQVSRPAVAHNEGEFSFDRYARTHRHRATLTSSHPACVIPTGHASGEGDGLIERTRQAGLDILSKHIDTNLQPLASAVLLGSRAQLDRERTDPFVKTGTIHLLAISGLHVGIVASFMLFLAMRLPVPRGLSLFMVAGLVFFYMLLTECRPPVVRATIVVLVACLALYLGRRAISVNALAAAALVVLAINPAELFQSGTQLSFLAVAAILWFVSITTTSTTPWLDRTLPDDPLATPQGKIVRGVLRWELQLFLVGTVIWLIAIPLVLSSFHVISPFAPLLNLVVWPLMALVLIFGFSTLALGALIPGLAELTGLVCGTMLAWLESAVLWTEQLPYSHFWAPGPERWWLLGFYGGLIAMAHLRLPVRWRIALVAVWIGIGSILPFAQERSRPPLTCTFASLGHGNSTIVELPSGKTILCDAGHFGAPRRATDTLSAMLWEKGITHLDAVFLSHPDMDHCNALPRMLERFSVGVVYVPPLMFDEKTEAVQRLKQVIEEAGVPIRELSSGDTLSDADGCRIEVLHPGAKGEIASDNANSLVLVIEYAGRRIFLPGDLAEPGISDVLAEQPRQFDVLLAPHHGIRKNNPPELAKWADPHWVILSHGTSRRHPVDATTDVYEASGAEVFSTAENGMVTVEVEADGKIRTDTFLQP